MWGKRIVVLVGLAGAPVLVPLALSTVSRVRQVRRGRATRPVPPGEPGRGREIEKAAGIVAMSEFLVRLAGYDRAATEAVRPLLIRLETMVYQGDLAFEAAQRAGDTEVDPAWREGIEIALAEHGLSGPDTDAAVAVLAGYFRAESRLLLGETEPDAENLLRLTYDRSSDIHLLWAVLHRIRGTQPAPELTALLRHWLALLEIGHDQLSYQRDRADNAFNLLRLQVRAHGPARAAAAVRELRAAITGPAAALITTADRHTLGALLVAMLAVDTAGAHLLPRLVALLPTPVSRRLALALLHADERRYGPLPELLSEQTRR
ncbi:hypothetical protein [Crossiella sp. CA198]|uniref:hypothetical protein n=1 Tax=Crossiella sp. CA198 TaxID=3455607 RepID=UPI003F8D3D18